VIPPTLAVQIVNYRTRSYLERCLPSVIADLEASGLSFEVNLLDNASGESLEDLAVADGRVTATTSDRNNGFGAGHNLLAAATQAEHLWLLNPDVELTEPDTAGRLLRTLSAPDAIQAVGPRLTGVDGEPQPYDHGRLRGARAQIAIRGGHSYWRASAVARRVAWTSGAALMLRRDTFQSLGGFDERLFLYKEEEDLCLRLRAAGGEVLYDPEVTVRHVGTVVADRPRWVAESERYYITKHLRPGLSQRAFAAVHHGLAYVHL
jgi:N-acetylglucosaminyl-diphospho-decaprenol L-rhamnosyltransferase